MIADNMNVWNSPTRQFKVNVELFAEDSSLPYQTFTERNYLKEFTIERVGESGKFFGFGILQKLTLKLADKDRVIDIHKREKLKVYIATVAGNKYINQCPYFYVAETSRDENTNELTVVAYDALYDLVNYTYKDLMIAPPYTLYDLIIQIPIAMEYKIMDIYLIPGAIPSRFNSLEYTKRLFDGTENLREVLDDVAEATQTIYFLNQDNCLTFIDLKAATDPVLTINKSDYFTLESQEKRTITGVCRATELGDNVSATTGDPGEMQFVRDNSFWELDDTIDATVEAALANIAGVSIQAFNCTWRGNYALSPGDRIAIVAKDDSVIEAFVIDDVIEYSGGLKQTTSWSYEEKQEDATNPSTLGEALKKTFARVDKANQEVTIVAGEVTSLKMTTDSITSSVTKIDENINDLVNTVSTKVSAEEVNFNINKALGAGVDKVTTSTGYTFNEQGLKVTKSDSEFSTEITDDGLKIYKKNKEALTVDNTGVKAEDLHATTFLLIGKNSRIEDYGSTRTGCFWIG